MTDNLAIREPNTIANLTDEAIDRVIYQMDQFEKFKNKALSKRKGRVFFGDTPYLDKGDWVALGLALNVSFEVVDDGRRVVGTDSEGDYYTWIFKGRATLPNGRTLQMDGACSSRDEFFSMARDENGAPVRRKDSEIDEKDIVATAQTNAFNRCLSFLFGFGELSAEEVRGKQFAKKAATFPYGDFKGKEPRDLDPAQLHRELAHWEKQAADPKNKFAAANAKLVAAIKEALAEKTAKPPSEAPKGGDANELGSGPHTTPPPVANAGGEDVRVWVARLLEQMERTGKGETDIREHLFNINSPVLSQLPHGARDYGKWPPQALVVICQWLSALPDAGHLV